jgi:hypothetical protein
MIYGSTAVLSGPFPNFLVKFRLLRAESLQSGDPMRCRLHPMVHSRLLILRLRRRDWKRLKIRINDKFGNQFRRLNRKAGQRREPDTVRSKRSQKADKIGNKPYLSSFFSGCDKPLLSSL